MDTRFLETFLTVARRGSLADAAVELDVTATAVAQRIRTLEAELGVKLIVRSGRSVRPTEAGYAILERAATVLRDLRDLGTAARGGDITGKLRVGAISTAQTGLFPRVLGRLAKRHPGLEVGLEPGTSAELYARTVAGELDVSAIVRPGFTLPKTVQFHRWRSEPLILLAPGDEPSRDAVALLTERPFIRYDRRQWGGRLAADYLEGRGIVPAQRFELDALEAIAVMVHNGLGVSIVPEWAGPWPEGLRLLRLPLPPPAPKRELGLVALRSTAEMHLIRKLVEIALESEEAQP
ncbi:LysR substrate-binding domain-containing protein [Acuticoccus sp. M5D2P5]|uniref:LysR substrate-binding domain-containing protein n=1 Tax=Acuticoccus kalidii TaxID=2910977 RepID=UPI001F2008DF|nr:LysR substrate-binding domain-containing protein [Acuticoccus kalidii]MCF3933839.1 LysR substrate-binding domain-containing protein [Acuticoccus kalidii]